MEDFKWSSQKVKSTCSFICYTNQNIRIDDYYKVIIFYSAKGYTVLIHILEYIKP